MVIANSIVVMIQMVVMVSDKDDGDVDSNIGNGVVSI